MEQARQRRLSRRLLGILSLAAGVLLLCDRGAASAAVVRGLELCAGTMIPSLFPFMVVAELLVCTGTGERLSRALVPMLRPLLGVGAAGACAWLLGMMCGFPVGARTAAGYLRRGEMDVREFQLLLCCANVPSAAYLIGAVGVSLFGSARAGQLLLMLAFLSALAVGVLFRRLLPRRVSGEVTYVGVQDREWMGGTGAFAHAVAAAAESMLRVCATVVLFSALTGALDAYLSLLALPSLPYWRAGLFGIFELSGGVASAAALSGEAALVLCAVMVGFGGLSVHCQILAVCGGCPVSVGWFAAARLLQAGLCGGGMWLALRLGWLRPPAGGSVPPAWQQTLLFQATERGHGLPIQLWWCICAACLVAGLALRLARKEIRQ